MYFHHGPKSSCSFCRKEGRRYVREPTWYISPGQPSLQFECVRTQCEYHSVVNFLRGRPEVQSGVVPQI